MAGEDARLHQKLVRLPLRRQMTKGQRAMAVAMVYPELNARGKKSVINTDFNSGTISHARTVLKWAPELVGGVGRGPQ